MFHGVIAVVSFAVCYVSDTISRFAVERKPGAGARIGVFAEGGQLRRRLIARMPGQDRRVPFRRPVINLIQGAKWTTLISKYIAVIPLNGGASRAARQSMSR
jgi:hypothetical protein